MTWYKLEIELGIAEFASKYDSNLMWTDFRYIDNIQFLDIYNTYFCKWETEDEILDIYSLRGCGKDGFMGLCRLQFLCISGN
jgi:hypothetical protein